ncbi:MAG: thermonuclease family protein, partial [Vicinamibacterales bacterium]
MRRHARILLLLIALTIAGCDVESATRTPTPTPTGEVGDGVPVVRVVDGDTIIVAIDGVEERLRYIGIDAPESVRPETPVECFGREASAENARLVEGKRVELEADISNRDRFGRLLRYVYV